MWSPMDGTPPQSDDRWRLSYQRQFEPILSEEFEMAKGKNQGSCCWELNPAPLA